jgi:hypothetical protein
MIVSLVILFGELLLNALTECLPWHSQLGIIDLFFGHSGIFFIFSFEVDFTKSKVICHTLGKD